jgi:hypothetical protein
MLKIISGGQTGADQATLDFAIEHGIPHGGWCPRGRISEDGVIPEKYQLQEMPTKDYPARTEKNAIDSDGTVIISISPKLSRGSFLTLKKAHEHKRPEIHIHRGTQNSGCVLAQFVKEHQIGVLNVAGPRASTEPKIGNFVREVLTATVTKLNQS